MRLNQYLAKATGLSRRQADEVIKCGRVTVNGQRGSFITEVTHNDNVIIDNRPVNLPKHQYVLFNKPRGYVVSRTKQGRTDTIYKILPKKYHHLKPVGRLDKDSCGLLLLTNDGQLSYKLTHPRSQKLKIYKIRLNQLIERPDLLRINRGIMLEDGPSRLKAKLNNNDLIITMKEGKKRQIRRTFATLGYKVTYLERLQFGSYKLGELKAGQYQELKSPA